MIRDEIRREISVAMANKLQEILPVAGGENWWKCYVIWQLTEAQQAQYSSLSSGSLMELDMAALLRVYYRNWDEMAAKKILEKAGKKYVCDLINARNKWAHEPASGQQLSELLVDFTAMENFLRVIGAPDPLVTKVAHYKNRISAVINDQNKLPEDDDSASSGTTSRRTPANGAGRGVAEGAGKALISIIDNATGLLIPESEFKNLSTILKEQAKEYRKLALSYKSRLKHAAITKNRNLLLDCLCIGGETLASFQVASEVPERILDAYRLTYPNEAETVSFSEKIKSLNDPEEIKGFSSGIKGKLFELQYVDHLNDGNLPSGYTATLPDSPTNPGWDIGITGPDNETVKVIQLKATESVDYVREALERYPHVDVVTTSEVYGNLVMQGLSENVANSGIALDQLDHEIDNSIEPLEAGIDFTPSVISMALIAFSSYSRDDLDGYGKGALIGERATKSYFSYLAAQGVAIISGTWWLGLIGGIGSRIMLESGKSRQVRLAKLEELVCSNTKTLERLRHQEHRLIAT